ncbi:hypothetical protein A33M_0540 [Rhodovulum sp. PH10]|uniref:invasion associated locus B family protein n=1 Tax=Rhodovulum sp. PH10 TaxID=1187851 RepID=UPI00027C2316|nr:invasion associated locus B family protein [Rhodovulum sp. PH10]EJW13048.1 hypothetical protein A33M_0540 [Rhodovulum sp. PH10]
MDFARDPKTRHSEFLSGRLTPAVDTTLGRLTPGVDTTLGRLTPALPVALLALGMVSTIAIEASAAPVVRLAQAGNSQPKLIGQYENWGAYTATPGGKKVCFALSKPVKAETDPPNRPRDPPYLFVSTRPAENVKDEVSVIFGYGLKPDADATITIGGSTFDLYTQGDGGWTKNVAEESRLVEAMRRGADATVKGVSSRGTTTTDQYSLMGVSQALDKAAAECR